MKDAVSNIIVVGDRVLISPKKESEQTKTGLYLPPGFQSREQIHSGYVIKVGPGYAIPSNEEDEPWKNGVQENVRYIPLQAKEGDLAIFLKKNAIEVMIGDGKYFIVPQNAILLLERDE
ncbi:MAG: co-chaperone GroES [Bacteroidales bacterium]|nr:co-chaperone GroES [Bacteroidales bacterium]